MELKGMMTTINGEVMHGQHHIAHGIRKGIIAECVDFHTDILRYLILDDTDCGF